MIQPYKDMLRQAETDLDAARAEIERLTKERDEVRAQVAAAYGSAADALQNVAENWDCGHNESRLCDCARDVEQWSFAADEIRHMTPTDAQAALESYGREKVREGMQRAANIAGQCWESGYRYQTKDMILAEIERLDRATRRDSAHDASPAVMDRRI